MERRVEDDVGPGSKRIRNLPQPRLQRKPLTRHFQDTASRGLQSVAMRRFMRVSHLLEKFRLLVV